MGIGVGVGVDNYNSSSSFTNVVFIDWKGRV